MIGRVSRVSARGGTSGETGLDTIVRDRDVAQQERVREWLRDWRDALACAVAANKRPISSRLAVDSRLVAALARRDPNSPRVFHRNGIPIRRSRTA